MSLTRQQFVLSAFAGLLLPAAGVAKETAFDAVVSLSPQPRINGPVFPTLGAALAAAPADAVKPYRIWIARGVWTEKLTIETPNIHLIGEDRKGTVIRFTAASGMMAPDGKPYGTYRTPTLTVKAPGFAAYNLTIENAFDGIAEMRKAPPKLHSHDPLGPQAVALFLTKASDNAVLTNIDLHSHQDTLFVDGGRSVFRDCLITGSYDFIFGAGAGLFLSCEIRSRLRPDPVEGYIAAPSTQTANPVGLIFHHCRLTRDAEVPDHTVFLGRPWRTSGKFDDGVYGDPNSVGMAAFITCWMDAHIHPDGWTEMWYTGKDGNPRTMLQPESVRFYERANSGPGGKPHRRGRPLDAKAARKLLATFA